VTFVRRLTALIAVVAVAASCSTGGSRIARVGDHVITTSDVAAFVTTESAPIGDPMRQIIFALVAYQALTDRLQADFGVGVSDADVQTEYDSLTGNMALQGIGPDQYFGLADASDEFTHFQAEFRALRNLIVHQLVAQPAFLDDLFSDPKQVSTVCVQHIIVDSQEAADAAKARLDAGEDFTTVANDVSTDTSSIDFGCVLAAGFVEPLGTTAAEATIGVPTDPVQSIYGWHILLVTDRTTLTRDEIIADPDGTLLASQTQNVFQTWFNETLQAATVDLEPEYGDWTAYGILPPGTASTTTTTTP
jgi:parvulin-like peptidyl-prolyl isomerase